MPEIIDLVDKSRIKELLRQYSSAFKISVLLLTKMEICFTSRRISVIQI
jgi:hypothetical protein